MSTRPTICDSCIRFDRYLVPDTDDAPATCTSFPDGIPDAIFPGGADHRESLRGEPAWAPDEAVMPDLLEAYEEFDAPAPEAKRAQPQVRTPEGAREFGEPIGSPIRRNVGSGAARELVGGVHAITPELKAARRAANAKLKTAPVPTAEDLERHRLSVMNNARQGGDSRGGAPQRRKRTAKLLAEFGDGETAPCVYCGTTLDAALLSQDRIYPGVLGGRYTIENLVPACRHCNASRPDEVMKPFRGGLR